MAQSNQLRRLLQKRIVFMDGATGTELLKRGMPAGVNTELWAMENMSVLRGMHSDYADAGADIVLTCTFGGTAAKLPAGSDAGQVNTILTEAALEEVGDRVLVAASIGPTGQLIHPSGSMSWLEVYRQYLQQVRALKEAGIDIFFLETFSDPRELKAAILAIRDIHPDAFISAQMTFTEGGLSISGTSPTALTLLANQLNVDAVGANCSTGPELLLPVIQEMSRFSSRTLTVEPNAGLPVNGLYEMTPERFAGWMEDLASSGAGIIGGCCGTGPLHVKCYTSLIGKRPVQQIESETLQALTSIDRIVPIGSRMLSVGESINPTGRKQLQKSISSGDFMAVISLARAQGRADLIDVNLGLERTIDEDFIHQLFSRLSLGAPVSIDLSQPDNIEKAFRELGGIGILNSLTASEKYIHDRIETLLRHGGYAVLLPIDGKGLGSTPDERLEKILRGIGILESAGFPRSRVIADPVVRPVATGITAQITIETMKLLKQSGLLTIAGISNVSHGLPGRSEMNAALLASMAGDGLDLAIIDVLDPTVLKVHRSSQIILGNLEPVEMRLPEQDPKGISPDYMSILRKSIIIGDRRQTESAGRELLESGITARTILEEGLASAMSQLGDLYSRKKLFLPHLIAAAEASTTLTTLLQPHLADSQPSRSRGRVVLASVKGDVHDIGKNLVGLFLSNSGFEVTDLGRDVSSETIIDKAEELDADIIALSALMSTTAPEMEVIISDSRRRKLRARILIGGAVVTREYADSIGAHGYASNAWQAVGEAERLVASEP